ncbi:HNH endonuclease signature motif containing protein [Cupriavidus sp. RAF12]|uniref:HNH endonuclease signature motif containing protein n=1 Tax=Cupriavidus sp. RAF12 TaxID=3233050 RepID=UPI003F8F433C
MAAKKTVVEKLSRYEVDAKTGCWNWTGCLCADGYGKVKLTIAGERYHLAHRASYVLAGGEIPPGREIDHRCKNRRCINPGHLVAATHAENVSRADYTMNHRNGRKTHCIRGHALMGDNVVLERTKTGMARKCRSCINLRSRRRYQAMAAMGIQIKEVK